MNDPVNASADIFALEGNASVPLGGLTFGAKDLFDVAGYVNGCGNPEWARTHQKADKHAPRYACCLTLARVRSERPIQMNSPTV